MFIFVLWNPTLPIVAHCPCKSTLVDVLLLKGGVLRYDPIGYSGLVSKSKAPATKAT